MLILSRKKEESILIGSEIEITVIAVQGDHVKLGIKAPKHIDVYRKELFEETKKENVEASELTINMNEFMKNTKYRS